MNQVIENILTRRSIRSFKDWPLAEDDLEQIVRAGIYAPSGMNRQSWHFSVLTGKDLIRKLASAIGKELGRDESYDFYNPAALIICSNERDNSNGEADCACAMENIMLAAHSLGIGSVWINQCKDTCDAPAVREILDRYAVPSGHRVYGMAALGYAAKDPESKPRAEGTVTYLKG
ncbi:nitroreductase family protein [Lachnotalea sp. AF33-28]|uniref:nitroreductase family protein n=1 Tax=Lachnotalea sp. AF33-28 TaxID=2292046 RepID=UPI000E46C853|nr:nitroreductase family protein [Lachnotalea sp. AF33-28]RHP29837.1 NAD(P)H nitroreductase [Lachnotalea sp. AF33-28]